MTTEAQRIGEAIASPTKAFFVTMLTRDIELQDALLDLLDNCIDGVLRTAKLDPNSSEPYKGFFAKITIAADHFSIEDNCGGIPIETAREHAFAMGRPPGVDGEIPATIGMYGIGMKRAIFKLGSEALVESRHDQGFVVEFSPQWMVTDTWEPLPMYELGDDELKDKGTRITVYKLNEEVAPSFSDPFWVDEFRKVVSRHFSIIIGKGFEVLIGSKDEDATAVKAEEFRLLSAAPSEAGTSQLAPFVYTGKLGEVEVEIYAGIYRELLSAEEGEEEEETRGTTDDAGWTVACNDRVVIWKDKTRLTGWGEANVPNYHGQFIAITGIVLLRSADPRKLPLTTTKRGIDAASNVYSEAKDLMREATKSLTSFTNKWKKFPTQLDSLYRASSYVSLPELRAMPEKVKLTTSRKLDQIKKFEPKYPEPPEEKTNVVVKFDAHKDDVRLLAKALFDDENVKPGVVGKQAFEAVLQETKQNK